MPSGPHRLRRRPHAGGAPSPHCVSFVLYLQTIRPRLLAADRSGVRHPRPLSLRRRPCVASTGGLHRRSRLSRVAGCPAPPCPLPRLRLMQRRRLLAASLSLRRRPCVASTAGLRRSRLSRVAGRPAPPCPLPRMRLMQRRRLLAASAASAAAASTLSSRPRGTPGCPSLVRCSASSAASTPARPLRPGRGRACGSGGRLRACAGGRLLPRPAVVPRRFGSALCRFMAGHPPRDRSL